ncbi:ferric reductase NAD binding domain-containing protein [Kalaharituber pfeilii]|nr:ferric reductase NAD binding domain-containing protein [Kalaharituber pfeilii]
MAGSTENHSTSGHNPVLSAQQLAQNKRAAWIFAATFSALISVFIIAHLTRTLFQQSGSRRRAKMGYIGRALIAPFSVYELQSIYGWVALAAFKIIYATSLQAIRKRFYEFFYMIHVMMLIIAVVFTGLHKPHNTATLIPLPGLATKVISKPVAFISIPKIWGFKATRSQSLAAVTWKPRRQSQGMVRRAVPDFGRFNRVVLIAGGSGGAFTFPIAMDLVRNMSRFCTVSVELVWVIGDERHITWYESEIEILQKSPYVNLSIYVTSQTDTIVSSQPVEVEASAEQDVRNSLYVDDDNDNEHEEADIESRIHSNASTSTYPSPSSESKKMPQYVLGQSGTESLAAFKEISLGREKVDSTVPTVSQDEKAKSSGSNGIAAKPKPETRTSQIDQWPTTQVKTLGGRPDLGTIVKGVVKVFEERDLVAVAACGPVELMRVTRNAVADSIELGGASVTLW